MAHFLVKSEPVKYPWSQLVKDKRTHWDGVRNHQAAINLKAMKVGDQGFFYHSNEGLEIVGICEVAKVAYPDPSDATGRFVMVDLKPVKPLKHPVTLATIKAEPRLKDFGLVRQGRLSVVSVSDAQWALILKMSEAAPK
jgi:predicted RNA-binding protein with PUA-like domain